MTKAAVCNHLRGGRGSALELTYLPGNKTSLRSRRNASDKNNFFAVKKLIIGRFEMRKTALIPAISDSSYGPTPKIT